MALKLWLPLNGDTNNLGIADFQPAAADIEYAESGKIGNKCLSGGTISMTAAQTASIFNNNEITIAFWIKTEESSSSATIFGNADFNAVNNNRKFSIWQWPTAQDLHWSWMNDAANEAGVFASDTIYNGLPANTWVHVCFAYKSSTLKVYLNGQIEKTQSGVVSNSTSFLYDTILLHSSNLRCVNDLRVYDHCLLINEVKTLAQGLIAHYKLTNFDNANEYDHSGYNNNLTLTGTIINDSDSPRYLSSVNFNNSGYYKKDDFNLTTEQFTCSFWIKPPVSTKSQHFLLGTHNTNWAPTNGFCMWRDKNATAYNYALCANGLSFFQGAININPGQWQHLVFVYNGTKLLGYKNGDVDNPILNITYGNNKPIHHSHCYLGNSTYRQAPTDETDETSMSDFRFYATALSTDDIKRLHQTPISLSQSGLLNAIEYIEHDNTVNNFQKTGIVSFNKITNYNLINATNINNWDETKDLPLAKQMQIFTNRIQSTDFIEW